MPAFGNQTEKKIWISHETNRISASCQSLNIAQMSYRI